MGGYPLGLGDGLPFLSSDFSNNVFGAAYVLTDCENLVLEAIMSKKRKTQKPCYYMRVIEQIQLRDQWLYRSIKQLVINLKVQSAANLFHFLNWEISIRE